MIWAENLNDLLEKADEMFECIWPFYGVDA